MRSSEWIMFACMAFYAAIAIASALERNWWRGLYYVAAILIQTGGDGHDLEGTGVIPSAFILSWAALAGSMCGPDVSWTRLTWTEAAPSIWRMPRSFRIASAVTRRSGSAG